MEDIIHLTDQNKDLLRRVLDRGMNGSYYDHGATPDVEGVRGYLQGTLDEISPAQVEEIASFYDLSGEDLLEIIADEAECEDWLERRSWPWDDPW